MNENSSTQSGKNRNELIDFAKIIASFFIVCIHSSFVGKDYVYPILRLSVPFFFIISGYLYERGVEHLAYCKKQAFKLLELCVLSSLFYFLIDLLLLGWKNDISNILGWLFSKNVIKSIFLYNYSPFWEPLWFLSALFYVWIIEFVICKLNIKQRFIIIPVLLICGLLLGKYFFIIGDRPNNVWLSRNFLFTGLPCFEIGRWISFWENAKLITSASNTKWFLVLTGALALLFSESLVLKNKTGDIGGDVYFFSSVCATLIILYIISHSNDNFSKAIPYINNLIGNKGTVLIYVLHGFIGILLERVIVGTGSLEHFYRLAQPIFVFGGTFFVVCIIRRGLSLIKKAE